ncbi:MAG TPA: histidine phosphatase family protein [Burkholderiales bacterium]
MDLILWRHADAEDGKPDLERALTPKGHKQAAAVAKWLRKRLPEDYALVSSPAVRARQTAEALQRSIRIEKQLAPGASVEAILKTAGNRGTVVLVGHQPDLGNALAYLLTGHAADWRLQKGALWWLADEPPIVRAVVSPDLL